MNQSETGSEIRAWLEFHDSTLVAVRQIGTTVEIGLAAYVHRWERIDGRWRGTGWAEAVKSVLAGARCPSSVPASPCGISTGLVSVGSLTYENMVPLPLKVVGLAELQLELTDGTVLNVRGEGIDIGTRGQGRAVEALPDEMLPRELA